jgi:hypothetical protein
MRTQTWLCLRENPKDEPAMSPTMRGCGHVWTDTTKPRICPLCLNPSTRIVPAPASNGYEPGAPNLDAQPRDELLSFDGYCRGRPVQTAKQLFPDRPAGYVRATRDLGHYAANKAAAMLCRSTGDITGALVYEKICDNIYNKLPAFARW